MSVKASKRLRRLLRFTAEWFRRQRAQRERARLAAAGKWVKPSGLSRASKRELDELLRDLGGESGE